MSSFTSFVLSTAALLSVTADYTCPSQYPIPTFNCPAELNPPIATNVNKLRFGNIKAVMAMGDSMTAAFAAEDLPVEYRGVSYSTGGDPGMICSFKNLAK
jgi:hypothetical protein